MSAVGLNGKPGHAIPGLDAEIGILSRILESQLSGVGLNGKPGHAIPGLDVSAVGLNCRVGFSYISESKLSAGFILTILDRLV